MAAKLAFVALLATLASVKGAQQHSGANPIRKVVTLLQKMAETVEAEGVKEKAMFEEYMCWCSTGGSDLKKSIGDAGVKVPAVQSDIEEGEAQLAQLKEDLATAQSDRSAAKTAMSEATAIREKESGTFAAMKAESDTNIAALTKAIAALEKGMSGAFLQSDSAKIVRNLLRKSQDDLDENQQDVLSFLSGTQDAAYAPQAGAITGIVKQLKDTMAKELADATATETSAIEAFKGLIAAKEKEVEALTAAIESKTVRSGELAVEIVQMKNDLSETEAALIGDKKFLENLEKDCGTKQAEWDEVCKTRAQELVALSETIKILNDDDALELFKKTLPSASASFMQMQVSAATVRASALAIVQGARANSKSGRVQLDLIALTLRGRKVNFDKVVKMVDDMVSLLKQEQHDDNDKREYCNLQFDTLDDKQKGLERSVSDLEKAVADAEESIAALTTELKALEEGIVELDKSVAEATAQRRAEDEEFKELMASDSAATELLGFAKNRLNKFYNPKMYKAAPKRQLSEEDQITVNNGGTLAPTAAPGGIAGTGVTVLADVSAHMEQTVAPPPPPEAVGAYKKKGEESSGVIAMIDLLVKDLAKEMTEAETSEKNAQAAYEQLMDDAAEKRSTDSKALSEKGAAKADTEMKLLKHKEERTSTGKELMATLEVIHALHGECDWLLQYFSVRKEARSDEIDSLVKAKAVLSGADFSLLQTSRSLRR